MEIVMRIKRVPYLPRLHRSVVKFFRGRLIEDYMTRSVVRLSVNATSSEIRQVLQNTEYSGFPVVTEQEKVLAVIPRDELEKSEDLQHLEANFNAFTVENNHDFLRCYRLFRHLGLRHMVVVEYKTKRLVGIITRQDLVKAITQVPKPHYYYIT
jgi:predicted transcriptional regulator